MFVYHFQIVNLFATASYEVKVLFYEYAKIAKTLTPRFKNLFSTLQNKVTQKTFRTII